MPLRSHSNSASVHLRLCYFYTYISASIKLTLYFYFRFSCSCVYAHVVLTHLFPLLLVLVLHLWFRPVYPQSRPSLLINHEHFSRLFGALLCANALVRWFLLFMLQFIRAGTANCAALLLNNSTVLFRVLLNSTRTTASFDAFQKKRCVLRKNNRVYSWKCSQQTTTFDS